MSPAVWLACPFIVRNQLTLAASTARQDDNARHAGAGLPSRTCHSRRKTLVAVAAGGSRLRSGRSQSWAFTVREFRASPGAAGPWRRDGGDDRIHCDIVVMDTAAGESCSWPGEARQFPAAEASAAPARRSAGKRECQENSDVCSHATRGSPDERG
jgi:hypothetical protein